ncbi:hypothetical protein [Brachybacterium sp. p3-SID957]|uniref:hypothetical protein n=1 Tax=Brachybacterium sp. p3-SID957 TaxID=2916049 RepID=UPI00223B9AAA|nr:hypothetical protein [Brachybacterium sp. p3-SID957]MCT1774478.1 hypothetical protein [Brachybacterium sp. p3-SID957]
MDEAQTVPVRGRRADTTAVDPSAVDHRYYDFRSQLRVVDTGDWLATFEQITRDWLEEKGYGVSGGYPSVRKEEAFDLRLDRIPLGAAFAIRLTLAERGDQGEWRTELLALADPDAGSWISATVRNSEGRFANRPRVVPRLLERIEVLDGRSELVDDTWAVQIQHLQEFLHVLGDRGRRAPVFVTAAPPGADLEKVRRWMSERSQELAGLAHSYVLDASANAALMQGLGPFMGVRPGTIRSFAPRPVAHDPTDALRHRVIGAARLQDSSLGATRALAGRIARFEAATIVEPLELREVRRAFDRKAVDDRYRRSPAQRDSTPRQGQERPPVWTPIPQGPSSLVRPERPLPVTPTSSPAGGPSPEVVEVPTPAPVIESPPPSPRTPAHRAPTPGSPSTPSPGPDPRPGEIAPVPDGARESVDALLAFFCTDSVDDVITEVRMMRALLDEAAEDAQRLLVQRDQHADVALELELTVDDLERELSNEINRRRTAEQNARTLTIYREPTAEPYAQPVHPLDLEQPEQFSDIPEALASLDRFVVFTGKRSVTEELDEYDLNHLGAKRCWEGITALFDYARARADGVHDGNLHTYLMSTPEGYAGFPTSQYAPVESETTMGRRDLAAQRRLPVPAEVDPGGYVTMWAHLKLKQIGRISPRLHFHDDVAGTGKIYVGYIGRHLGISGS